jgi:hypothetical protein
MRIALSDQVAAIDAALAECGKLRFALRELTLARTLRATILEEERLAALLVTLVTKDAEEHYDEMGRALDAADAIRFESPAVVTLRAKWRQVADRRQCRAAMQAATAASDEAGIAEQLTRAKELGMKTDAVQAAAEYVSLALFVSYIIDLRFCRIHRGLRSFVCKRLT